ncbi:MAG: hypothetical protein IT385_23190 [Deltaproteobacteria bacterium]|nr:hypothetical protein [Deltaproteobacteria bacterium]
MSKRTVTLRSSILVVIGAATVTACDSLSTADDTRVEPAVAAMALEDAHLPTGGRAAWQVEVEVESAAPLRITVPAGVAALERRAAAERVEGVHMIEPGMLARSAAPTRFAAPARDGLELSLFDGRTGDLVAHTVVEDEREALLVEIEDPCQARPRCALRLRLEARWLGRDAVRVSPDFEIESALGQLHLLGE